MQFKILGPLEVRNGDEAVEVTSRKQRALLGLLLLSPNRVVSSDRLLDELWGEEPPSGGLSTLRFHVSKLRDALQPGRRHGEDGLIMTRSPGYVLAVDPEDVDAARFELLVQEARRVLLSDPARASLLFGEALELWRGPALADFLDEPFADLETRRLDEMRLAALEDRVEADLALGRHGDLVPELQKLTSEHPYRERLWGQLMVAQYRCNRQADALRTYQRLRRRLGEDLGIEPSADIRQLEERILLQDEELRTPGAVQPPGGRLRGYVLDDKLGQGAFGVVWRAHQPAMGRDVAIKVIKPELSNRPGFVRRFEAEARLVASLEHPHIVPVLDFWRDPDGAYLVMRLMERGAVDKAETAHRPPNEVLSILEQVASALAFAHRRGLVHGDLHPGNVLLDEDGNAFLADFGLATRLTGSASTPPETYASPEQRRGGAPTVASDVFGMGMLAYRLFTGSDPPQGTLPDIAGTGSDLPAEVDPILKRGTSTDPATRFPGVDELLDELHGAFGRAPSEPRVERRNPYKGLRAFDEADASDFFGRTRVVAELLDAVARHRLVGVVGPSGSGKSSVVRAGLVPALRSGRLADADHWLITDMYPGEDPFVELAEAVRRVAVHEPPNLAERLRNPATLIDGVRSALPRGAGLVLIVDQFEELFTTCRDDELRRAFMTALRSLATDPRADTRIITTLRADFYGLPLQYQPFGDLLRESVVTITPPGREELEAAIALPARQVGVAVEPELVSQIVSEMLEQPGSLPLMEYALTRLFDERSGQALTVDEYLHNGGLVGALAGWPEQLYDTLSTPEREVARQVWLRLVTVDEDGHDTRRRVPLPELHHLGIETHLVDRVLSDYGAARLLTFDRDPETRLPTVEVAHEALLARWERLRRWIDERREQLVLHRRLRNAVGDWLARDRDPEYLLQGGRLHQFEAWARDTDLAPADTEREFLRSSRTRQDEAATRRRRIRRSITAVLAVLAVTAGVFGAVAVGQRNRAADQRALAEEQAALARQQAAEADQQRARAEEQTALAEEQTALAEEQTALAEEQTARAQRQEAAAAEEADLRLRQQTAAELEALLARSRGLAAAAIANLETDPELSVLLAIEAVETTKSVDGTVLPEAEIALHAALSRNRLVATLPTQFYTRSVTFSPDAAALYVGGFESQVTPLPSARREVGPQFSASRNLDPAPIHAYATAVSVVAGRDDEFLVVGDFGGGLFALDRRTLEEVFSLDGHGLWITDLAVSADGTRVATISGLDGKAFVWDLVERRPIREFALDCGEGGDCTVGITLSEAKGVALSPDGALIGFADTVWNVADGSPVSVPWEQPGGAILEFLPDGERVVVAEGSAVRIVDLATGATLDALYGHTSEITRVAVSRDGSRLATAARDGLIHVWELRAAGAGRILTLAGHQGPAWEVAFSPDGRYLASAGGIQDFSLGDWSLGPPYVWEARVWDLAPAAGHEWMGASLDSPVAAFHPDGTLLLAAADDGVSVWDPATGAVVDDFALPIGAKAQVLATSPDGHLIAVGGSAQPGRDGQRGWLALYDYATSEPSLELIAAGAGPVPTDVSFSPDGTLLAAVTEAEIRVWETTNGETTFHHDNSEVRPQYAAVGFSPDGSLLTTLAVSGEDAFFIPGGTIWDLASGEPRTFIGLFARGDRGDVAYSPTQPLLVTAGLGRPIVSEAYTGTRLGTLWAPVSYAGAAAFSPDGALIATGEADGAVRLWDASTARQELTLIGHDSEVVSVTFSDDGTRLASVDLDGTLRVWALDIDDLLAIARDRVTRDLTDDECATYLPESCPQVAETEPVLPADYRRTVPPGVTDEAWAGAPSGGAWERTAAAGFSGEILAYDERSRLLLVQGEEGFSVVDPVTGEAQDATDIPLLEIGEEEEEEEEEKEEEEEAELLPRYTAAAAYDPSGDQIIVYTAEQGGVLAYDAVADRWTVLTTVEDLLSEEDLEPDVQGIVHGPFGDYGQGMVYDAESELIVLFGGATWGRINFGNHVGLSQTWLYDPAANTWERIDPELSPPGRVGHAMAYDVQSDRIILFGGSPGIAVDGDLLADTWAFDADTGTWTEMSPAISPPAREGAVMWYDPTVDLVFLFGGAEGGLPWEVFGGEELWAYDYDSDSWTLYRVDPNPGYRANANVIFDAEAGAARFYGGDWYDIERRFQGFVPDMWTYRHTPAGS